MPFAILVQNLKLVIFPIPQVNSRRSFGGAGAQDKLARQGRLNIRIRITRHEQAQGRGTGHMDDNGQRRERALGRPGIPGVRKPDRKTTNLHHRISPLMLISPDSGSRGWADGTRVSRARARASGQLWIPGAREADRTAEVTIQGIITRPYHIYIDIFFYRSSGLDRWHTGIEDAGGQGLQDDSGLSYTNTFFSPLDPWSWAGGTRAQGTWHRERG